jgi:hypothetical protein
MAIVVTGETRLVVQGITGREGSFHTLRNREYGTNVVAGVTPGKGGQDVEGIPVYDTVHDAVRREGANTAMVFVPPRFAGDAIHEAADAGVETIVGITEGIPAHDMLRIYNHVRPRGVTLLGPNCPGALSPGLANVGIIPAQVFARGRITGESPSVKTYLGRAGRPRPRQLDDRRDRRRSRRRAVVHRRPRPVRGRRRHRPRGHGVGEIGGDEEGRRRRSSASGCTPSSRTSPASRLRPDGR